METGCGASTIVLSFLAFKYNKILYSWDTNQNKLSYIRQIICDTHQRIFSKSLYDHWCYIGYLSNSDELGIGVLKELNKTIDFAFFDSEHTADTLLSEIRLALPMVNDGSVFAFDDANYDYKYKNVSYINVFRKKLGLSEIKRSEDNYSSKFYILAKDEILKSFPNSFKNSDTYKQDFKKDIFWQYFSNDREIMNSVGMEKMLELEHRYDSYTIIK